MTGISLIFAGVLAGVGVGVPIGMIVAAALWEGMR